MFPEIIADESVDFRIIEYLRESGLNVYSILENNKGISDKDVIKIAQKMKCLLLTEDSDFGEWVFAHGIKNLSVVFLRYEVINLKKIQISLLNVIKKYEDNLYNKFIVITVNKVRIREIL